MNRTSSLSLQIAFFIIMIWSDLFFGAYAGDPGHRGLHLARCRWPTPSLRA